MKHVGVTQSDIKKIISQEREAKPHIPDSPIIKTQIQAKRQSGLKMEKDLSLWPLGYRRVGGGNKGQQELLVTY